MPVPHRYGATAHPAHCLICAQVIMRLRREVNKSGHLRTLRHKRFHEDAREKKKRKVAEARRKMKFMRQRKRRSQQQGP